MRSAILAFLLPSIGNAATLTIEARAADGRPLPGAVVSLEVPGLAPAIPRGSYVMAQHNISFEPHVLVVPVGATVSFPNRDMVRHHVYSFSKAKKFELKLYGHEEARTVQFDKPGPVTLGCNIHDRMNGIIYVSASRFAGVTDNSGRISFAEVPQGRATVLVWDASIRQPDNLARQSVEIGRTEASTVVVNAR